MLRPLLSSAVSFFFTLTLASCGGGNTTAAPATSSTNAYAAAYQKATYNNGTNGTVTVSFPSNCSMTIASTGAPYSHDAYYLTPVQNGGTAVATTASGIQLSLSAFSGGLATTKSLAATFNTCPSKASSTTATGGGAIGFIFAGNALFNPYEATQTAALADNVTYTFTQNGVTYTAGFLDSCNAHNNQTSTWHFHGNPTCWTSVVDGAAGASHIIGIALDGYPIYGGRDVNGNVIDVSTLDACNGITSATPEFPSGAYHYVLPIDSTGKALKSSRSSINCYSGTVSTTIAAQMKALGCKMPMLLANGKLRLPDGRDVSRTAAAAWMRQTMPGMNMPLPGDVQVATSDRSLGAPVQHRSKTTMPGM